MITDVTAVTFRQQLGDMLNQVQYRRDSIVINKDGKPVAALIDPALFARICRMQNKFNDLSDRIAAGFESIPEANGMELIDAAVMLARKKQKGK